MKILSHRGYWKEKIEKNSVLAFERSFSLNFGTETDIRDFNQELIISHDIANGKEITLEKFLSLASSFHKIEPLTLALNIKADGLAKLLADIIKHHPNLDCFVFDMSVPDTLSYFDLNIPVFTRMSEVEKKPVWLEQSQGVWLDSFEKEWFDTSTIKDLLAINKRVCIVSPELHGREYKKFWNTIKSLSNEKDLMLCTDYPEEAKVFF